MPIDLFEFRQRDQRIEKKGYEFCLLFFSFGEKKKTSSASIATCDDVLSNFSMKAIRSNWWFRRRIILSGNGIISSFTTIGNGFTGQMHVRNWTKWKTMKVNETKGENNEKHKAQRVFSSRSFCRLFLWLFSLFIRLNSTCVDLFTIRFSRLVFYAENVWALAEHFINTK